MAACEWAILCDYSFQDSGRKTCLIGVFDRIFAKHVPATHRQAALALKVVGDPGEKVRIRVEIRRPAGGQLAKLEGAANTGSRGSAELQLNIVGLPIPDYGDYSITIFLNDESAKELVFKVSEPPTSTPGGEHIH